MALLIGEKIKKMRRDRSLTQEEMAAHLGISFQAVSKWERGDGLPDITLLPALSRYFGVTADELLGMEKINERMIGAKKPTTAPYSHPQIYEHKSTGRCIGKSILPMVSICMVSDGSRSAKARNIPANIKFKYVFFFIALIIAFKSRSVKC